MNFAKHAFLLSLIEGLETAGAPADRSHIHKTLFLLQAVVGDQVPFAFVYRNGPYSYDIEEELSQMRSYAAVTDVTPQSSNALQEGLITFRADQNARLLREQYRPDPATLQRIGAVCGFVGAVGKPPVELDRQATVAWIMCRENIQDDPAIVSRFQELKPNSSRENIEQAARLVKEWFDKAKAFERDPTGAAVAMAA